MRKNKKNHPSCYSILYIFSLLPLSTPPSGMYSLQHTFRILFLFSPRVYMVFIYVCRKKNEKLNSFIILFQRMHIFFFQKSVMLHTCKRNMHSLVGSAVCACVFDCPKLWLFSVLSTRPLLLHSAECVCMCVCQFL